MDHVYREWYSGLEGPGGEASMSIVQLEARFCSAFYPLRLTPYLHSLHLVPLTIPRVIERREKLRSAIWVALQTETKHREREEKGEKGGKDRKPL